MTTAVEFLRQLSERLQTQDNAYTASPNYCIQENRLFFGIDEDYSSKIGWFAEEANNPEAENSRKHRALERYYDRYGKEPDGWTRCGYEYRWVYCGINFLTHTAAHEYVARCNQRHTYEIRVYVDSHYRNAEMKEVRRLLAGPLAAIVEAADKLQARLPSDGWALGSYFAKDELNAMREAIAALDTAKEPQQ